MLVVNHFVKDLKLLNESQLVDCSDFYNSEYAKELGSETILENRLKKAFLNAGFYSAIIFGEHVNSSKHIYALIPKHYRDRVKIKLPKKAILSPALLIGTGGNNLKRVADCINEQAKSRLVTKLILVVPE